MTRSQFKSKIVIKHQEGEYLTPTYLSIDTPYCKYGQAYFSLNDQACIDRFMGFYYKMYRQDCSL